MHRATPAGARQLDLSADVGKTIEGGPQQIPKLRQANWRRHAT
jgi:hypothetical protein